MSISLYDFSIAALSRALTNLSAILDKAAAHAEAKKIDPVVLTQARLFPDMFPFNRQVQVACDTAKGAAARLAGIERLAMHAHAGKGRQQGRMNIDDSSFPFTDEVIAVNAHEAGFANEAHIRFAQRRDTIQGIGRRAHRRADAQAPNGVLAGVRKLGRLLKVGGVASEAGSRKPRELPNGP